MFTIAGGISYPVRDPFALRVGISASNISKLTRA
jgi:hypothetical protein